MNNHTNYHTSTVYFGDTDAAGVVYYGTYLKFYEMGRIEYLKEINYPYKQCRQEGFELVPVQVSINYLRPLTFEDQFIIATTISDTKKASLTMTQSISINKTMYNKATIKLACLNKHSFKPTPLPTQFIKSVTH